jgi:Protein of unknown function (DUF732)/Domain of unknown function (DUF4189)
MPKSRWAPTELQVELRSVILGVEEWPDDGLSDDIESDTALWAKDGAGDSETAIVAPVTQLAPMLAWSVDEDETVQLHHSWASVWGQATVMVALAAAVAVVIGILGWLGFRGDDAPVVPPPSTMPAAALPPISTVAQATTMTVQAAPPIVTVTPAAPSPPAAPHAARPDDDEFVALAISPRAIGSPNMRGGGFGTSGTQARADQIALSECRATGNDDCLLINAGMFHGCVAYAIDSATHTWAGGSGADESQARMDATRRIGTTPAFVTAKCSTPPEVTPAPPMSMQTVDPKPTERIPPPTTATVQAAPRVIDPGPSEADLDEQYLNDLTGAGLKITSVREVIAGAHNVCAYLGAGHSEADAVGTAMNGNTTLTEGNARTLVDSAVRVYCPDEE